MEGVGYWEDDTGMGDYGDMGDEDNIDDPEGDKLGDAEFDKIMKEEGLEDLNKNTDWDKVDEN
jgi:hypothetical protein